MNQDTDLDDALNFVENEIQREASQSGQPLTEEEGILLNNLPTAPVFPLTSATDPAQRPVPRDLAYERLIAVAKEARQRDNRVGSISDRKWRYAATVCKLNRHPMSWLLHWAGIREENSWWDRSLLIISATFLALCLITIILLGIIDAWTRSTWIAGGIGYCVLVLSLYFGTRHLEDRQLRRDVEKYRLVSQDQSGQLL
jgi:hypothetical protein